MTNIAELLKRLNEERDEGRDIYENKKDELGFHSNQFLHLKPHWKDSSLFPNGLFEKVTDYESALKQLEKQICKEAFPIIETYKEWLEKNQFLIPPDLGDIINISIRKIIPDKYIDGFIGEIKKLILTKYSSQRDALFQKALAIYEEWIPYLESKVEER